VNIVGIIPARMGSSRFPGKPMANILGVPMIGHVYYRTKMCSFLTETYVATCDIEIYDYIKKIGGNVVMTADTHERCTDRTAEAMLKIESDIGEKIDIVVMVQGDEPMVTPKMIESAIEPFLNNVTEKIKVVNLMAEMDSIDSFEDPNEVKVVTGLDGNALYFSREPIPSRKKGAVNVPMMKQVCIIPFRRDYLLHFNEMPETPLEKIESVDMMRILENGENVKMVMTDQITLSVDTPEDLKNVIKMMANDNYIQHYGV
jgi:3-deoxy-manno-octulosonate cytidylyltransferase (CMP-KDO synthetase)